MKQSEIKMDISGNPLRNPFYDPGPVTVNGVRVTVSIPFVGDSNLWKLRPNTYTTTFPIGDVHRSRGDGGTLEINIEQPVDEDPARIKQTLDRQLSDVRFYIENQRNQIASEMADLPRRITSAIADRRQRLLKHSNLSQLLGIPAAAPENSPLSLPQPVPNSRSPEARRRVFENRSGRWDVFISHASEDKDEFARPLAEALRAAGIRVWFDEFTLGIGDSLRRSIDKGLANSRYGVVVISPSFLAKEWPQKELDGLMAREVNGEKVILPVWHNIDRDAVAKYSPMLADRLAANSAKGLAVVVQELHSVINGHS